MRARSRSRSVLDLLQAYESRNVTFQDPDGSWPIVWQRARGVHVWDADGRKYLDLTAAFGVAAAGHANPRVIRAGQRQLAELTHAMGDVHPHARKAELARELSRITFERWTRGKFKAQSSKLKSPRTKPEPAPTESRLTGKVIFGNSGFEAVEAALKTALLATGKPGIIAFHGGYHGLGYGALTATHRPFFRQPFESQLAKFGHFVPFPVSSGEEGAGDGSGARASVDEVVEQIRKLCRRRAIGAILVEPVQARGGINMPPAEFLPRLRALCDEHGALLVLDEIYTGFGRTGRWFACEHSGTVPDVICLGKALTGGFPLSACVGKAAVMDAWPATHGEALHTSTFLGHPVGCAMALAQIRELESRDLPGRSQRLGQWLLRLLVASLPHQAKDVRCRGLGLMAGVEFRARDGAAVMDLVKGLLRRGFIVLPEGERGNVLSFTPPLVINQAQLQSAVEALAARLRGNR